MDSASKLPELGSFILLGSSQSGKSSFINTLSGCVIAAVGEGDGSSCTTTTKRYDINSQVLGAHVQIIDFPGFIDSDLEFTDNDILNLLKGEMSKLISEECSLRGFFIFESMGSDCSNLLDSLNKLCSLCGLEAKRSTIVIISKIDLEDDNTLRSDFTEKLCSEQRIPCVKWTNELKTASNDFKRRQFGDLNRAISITSPFHSGILLLLEAEIKQVAQKLCNNQKKATKDEILELATKMSNASVSVPEIRIKSEIVETIKEHVWYRNVASGGFIGNLTGKKRGEKVVDLYKVQEVITNTYNEMVKMSPQVFIPLATEALAPRPVEFFIPDAAAIKANEIKEQLRSSSFRIE